MLPEAVMEGEGNAGPPSTPVKAPAAVIRLAGAGAAVPVWQNELGGLTFHLEGGGESRYLKWAPAGSGLDLEAEAARLRWAEPFLRCPRVLGLGADGEGSWLLTAALPGESAVGERWRSRPEAAVRAVGSGLRTLHDSLPPESCPFSWSVEDRLAALRRPAPAPAQRPPSVDRLVVCHGDACCPNTLVASDGSWCGAVDLGQLGLADRWADLAVATSSTVWNYGPGWEEALLEAYGVDPDEERTQYYRLLWELT